METACRQKKRKKGWSHQGGLEALSQVSYHRTWGAFPGDFMPCERWRWRHRCEDEWRAYRTPLLQGDDRYVSGNNERRQKRWDRQTEREMESWSAFRIYNLQSVWFVLIGGAHQRWRERQAAHWGFQLIHRWRDTLGTVRHQRLDLNFEFFLAVLVVLGVAGGVILLSFGSWWTFVKDKAKRMSTESKGWRIINPLHAEMILQYISPNHVAYVK